MNMKIKTIKEKVSFELEEKKSRFIACLIPVNSEKEAQEELNRIKDDNKQARHNCYAYRVMEKNEDNSYNLRERASDDGEPQGTAGSPMLDLLKSKDLVNVILVVTRYFGGILLGTGGLVRAYTDSSIGAIENAEIVEKELGLIYKIEVDYSKQKDIEYTCNKNSINILNSDYQEKITYTLSSNEEASKKIEEITDIIILDKNVFI